MICVMTSPDAILRNGTPDQALVATLKNICAAGNPVGIISNHGEPNWFKGNFGGSNVQFIQNYGRQSGEIVSINSAHFGINQSDVFVLASKNEDVQMGKNGRAVLIAAGWSTSPQVKALGISVDNATQFQEVIHLNSNWAGHWWFSGNAPRYRVCALADLSGYGKTVTQQEFAARVKNTVKGGGGNLNALLAVTSRSLLIDGYDGTPNLVWGVYPSSNSNNDDTDTLSDFTHRLRTTVSRVRFSQRGIPLFTRHTPSVKRSAGGGGDRTDPSGQILTLHLNPYYKSGRLVNKHVVMIDDCTTYGVSFAVAAAFLIKAGAAAVTGIALGKFGYQLRHYEIDIHTDPFSPVPANGFTVTSQGFLHGASNQATQQVLQTLIS